MAPAWATAAACGREKTVVQNVSTPSCASARKRAQAVRGARDLDDDLVGHPREEVAHVEQLLGRVAVDLDDDGLVGDVEVSLDDAANLTVLLDHVVEHHRVGDDARGAPVHPGLQVFRVAGQPDSRSAASAAGPPLPGRSPPAPRRSC